MEAFAVRQKVVPSASTGSGSSSSDSCSCAWRGKQTPVEMWWHTVTHGRGSEGETGEWSGKPVPFTLPQKMVYPALLPLTRTPRLPVVEWTDAPADLNGLVRFAERWNLVSARVSSHFNWSLAVTAFSGSMRTACSLSDFRLPSWSRWPSTALLEYQAANSGNSLPTFRDNLWVPSSKVKNPRTHLVGNTCQSYKYPKSTSVLRSSFYLRHPVLQY
jgi:hypothetical protein